MTHAVPRPFSMRSFVAVAMTTAAMFLPLSGLMNHVYQFSTEPARHTWMAVHNSASILFLVFGIWHVVLNWKPLCAHVRRVRDGLTAPRREALVGALLVMVFVGLAAAHTLADARERPVGGERPAIEQRRGGENAPRPDFGGRRS